MGLMDRFLQGDRRALSRLITMTENGSSGGWEALRELYPKAGRAHVVGITGPPGVGKSTLIARLIKLLRADEKQVGVIAVDPTSPLTGGALLGDRIRMEEFSLDSGVYIRSMATRSGHGGISRGVVHAVTLLDAFGMDYCLVESVGTGQSEVAIRNVAHTSILVTVPALGDDVQALKAGIIEEADIFVINKADLGGADRKEAELRAILDLAESEEGSWSPPILQTSSLGSEGVEQVIDAWEEHLRFIRASDIMSKKRKEQCRTAILDAVREKLESRIFDTLPKEEIDSMIDRVASWETDPYSAASELLARLDMIGGVSNEPG